MKSAQFTVLLCFGSWSISLAQGPALEWGSQITSPGYVEASAAVDPDGNVYTLGHFTGEVDFDPSSNEYLMTAVGAGNSTDLYLQKLDSTGSFIWAKKWGGNGNEGAWQPPPPQSINGLQADIQIDMEGSIYITATYVSDSIDLDPDAGEVFVHSNGGYDLFVLKLDAMGVFIWGHSFGSIGHDMPGTMALDIDNNVLLTGSFGYTVDFDPSPVSEALLTADETFAPDPFLLKLNTDGELEWVLKSPGGGHYVDTDSQGNVYVAGWFTELTDFDPGPDTHWVQSASNARYLLKLNAEGAFDRVDVFHHGDHHAVFVVDNSDHVWLAGAFTGSVDVDPTDSVHLVTAAYTGHEEFLIRLSPVGELVWSGQIQAYVDDMAVDQDNSLYIIGGVLSGAQDIDPGPDVMPITGVGLGWIYVLKLDSMGKFDWVRSTSPAAYVEPTTLRVELDPDYNIYLSGSFKRSADFDPSPETSHILTSYNNDWPDGFTVKWSQPDVLVNVWDAGMGAHQLTVYPNPSTGPLSLSWSSTTAAAYTLICYDAQGREVHHHSGQTTTGSTTVQLELSHFPKGMYIGQLVQDGKPYSFKWIKR